MKWEGEPNSYKVNLERIHKAIQRKASEAPDDLQRWLRYTNYLRLLYLVPLGMVAGDGIEIRLPKEEREQ